MSVINFRRKEIVAKVVYYGPGLSGKTTNVQQIHSSMPEGARGELSSLATEQDRTLFFDYVPLHLGNIGGFKTRFQIFTVPGQVYYSATRRIVLQATDGVVFVADSHPEAMHRNLESLEDLKKNLLHYDKFLKAIPFVIQYNKRDLSDALPVEELEERLNQGKVPSVPATAVEGDGVLETLSKISSLVLTHLKTSIEGKLTRGVKSDDMEERFDEEEIRDESLVRQLLEQISEVRKDEHAAEICIVDDDEEQPRPVVGPGAHQGAASGPAGSNVSQDAATRDGQPTPSSSAREDLPEETQPVSSSATQEEADRKAQAVSSSATQEAHPKTPPALSSAVQAGAPPEERAASLEGAPQVPSSTPPPPVPSPRHSIARMKTPVAPRGPAAAVQSAPQGSERPAASIQSQPIVARGTIRSGEATSSAPKGQSELQSLPFHEVKTDPGRPALDSALHSENAGRQPTASSGSAASSGEQPAASRSAVGSGGQSAGSSDPAVSATERPSAAGSSVSRADQPSEASGYSPSTASHSTAATARAANTGGRSSMSSEQATSKTDMPPADDSTGQPVAPPQAREATYEVSRNDAFQEVGSQARPDAPPERPALTPARTSDEKAALSHRPSDPPPWDSRKSGERRPDPVAISPSSSPIPLAIQSRGKLEVVDVGQVSYRGSDFAVPLSVHDEKIGENRAIMVQFRLVDPSDMPPPPPLPIYVMAWLGGVTFLAILAFILAVV